MKSLSSFIPNLGTLINLNTLPFLLIALCIFIVILILIISRPKKRKRKKVKKIKKKETLPQVQIPASVQKKKSKIKIFIRVGGLIGGNIGAIVLAAFLLYILYAWYPYLWLYRFIISLINKDPSAIHQLYFYLEYYGIYAAIIAAIILVFYITLWNVIFHKLYWIDEDNNETEIGRAYFWDKEEKVIHVNLDRFLHILKPSKSMRKIFYEDEQCIERKGNGLYIHAKGIVHIQDDKYEVYGEIIPRQEVSRHRIEKKLDEQQALVGYRTMKSLHYNSELNKDKYKSAIALVPIELFTTEYKAPEESFKGSVNVLKESIDSFLEIRNQALTDETVRDQLADRLSPLFMDVYRYSKSLESYFPELKEKNDKVKKRVEELNKRTTKYIKSGTKPSLAIDEKTMEQYVLGVKAIIDNLEDTGVIEE